MNLLIRAVITGFGLKIGAELAKALSAKVKTAADDPAAAKGQEGAESDDDDLPSSTVPPDPPLV